MKWINFTELFFHIFWKYNFNFYGKSLKENSWKWFIWFHEFWSGFSLKNLWPVTVSLLKNTYFFSAKFFRNLRLLLVPTVNTILLIWSQFNLFGLLLVSTVCPIWIRTFLSRCHILFKQKRWRNFFNQVVDKESFRCSIMY